MTKDFWGRFVIHIPSQLWKECVKSETIKVFCENTKGYLITDKSVYFIPILYLEGRVIQRFIEVDITMTKHIPVGEDIHITIKPNTDKGKLLENNQEVLVEAKSIVDGKKYYIEYTTEYKKHSEPYQPTSILEERIIKYKGKRYRYGEAKL